MRTDADGATFAAELGKLLAWAGKGGRIRAVDVEANVGRILGGRVRALRRDRPEDAGALQRLERLFDGRTCGRAIAPSTRSRRSGPSSSSG
jgi:hypothetical protein